ncbi:MAG TPA: pseudouridine-5'-phosphate glycosidase [Vicinamibacteria bacterium]
MTHGLPAEDGLRVGEELVAEVRRAGAVPAVVAVWEGRLRVGLTAAQLAGLAHAPRAVKANLGNLAACVASGQPASTTVSATVFAAHRAGIAVCATGGIGGVHRGFSETGDASSDLTALARFPVAVVCSGAKAVLDLPRTVEALETLGVPVFGLGTNEFPAFYRRGSGLPVDRRFDDLAALAQAVRAHFALGLGTGVVVANPVPAEHELPREVYEAALAGALDDAGRAAVRGRDVTPFLLERMRVRTEGASVFSNRALLLANARAGAGLADYLLR